MTLDHDAVRADFAAIEFAVAVGVAAAHDAISDTDGEIDTETVVAIAVRAALTADRDAARAKVRRLKELVADLASDEDCWFDHHGGCQAHGYLSLESGQKCPHQEAKEVLTENGTTT